MGMGATAGAADVNGQSCTCVPGHSGVMGCFTANDCGCVCNEVPCTTGGGLSGSENCLDADCTTCSSRRVKPEAGNLQTRVFEVLGARFTRPAPRPTVFLWRVSTARAP